MSLRAAADENQDSRRLAYLFRKADILVQLNRRRRLMREISYQRALVMFRRVRSDYTARRADWLITWSDISFVHSVDIGSLFAVISLPSRGSLLHAYNAARAL